MTRLPELSHMLVSPRFDVLAVQFDDILNLCEIFSPLLPLDPALTFFAPLVSNVKDIRGAVATFARNSEGLYVPYNGADWRTASINEARFESGKILMEPASTNVFWNSASPATQTRTLNATGQWTISVHGSGSVTSSNGTGTATGHGTATDGSPVTINVTGIGTFTFTVSGSPDYVQVENKPVATSPIVTQAASASRADDKLTYADANQFFEQAQGMALITIRTEFDKAAFSGLAGLLTVNSAVRGNLLYFNSALRSTDNTNTAALAMPNYVKGDTIRCAVVYGPAGASALQVGHSLNNQAWSWSAAATYDGGFSADNILAVSLNPSYPISLSDARLYNVNRGNAWVEANY